MASVKVQRGPFRAAFTTALNKLKLELDKNECDVGLVAKHFKKVQFRREKLMELDSRVKEELMANEDTTEADFTAEIDACLLYSDEFGEIEDRVQAVLKPKEDFETATSGSGGSTAAPKKTYRLPKLEWKKFGGDPKEWLGFWSHFQSIHEDESMAPQDKFQYLIQATLEKSKARAVVESFPPSPENYPKAVDYLKKRFGKDDVLVEVYTRELLRLVLERKC